MKAMKIALTALFCVFIAAFGVATLILPDAEFSENENRVLAQAPELTAEKFFSGEFGEDFEKYLADQFPLRETFVSVKAKAEQLSGKKENNGAYLCGDTLISRLDEPDYERIDRNLGYLNTLAEKLGEAGIDGYISVIPTAADVWADRLPYGAPTADQGEIIDYIRENTALRYVDTRSALQSHASEDVFYRTDHHWTTRGAYYGYVALCEAMDLEPKPESAFEKTVLSDSFYGTTYSSSGVRDIAPDRMEAWADESGFSVTRVDETGEHESELYVESFLEEKDKYSTFLGGNCPLVIIKNERNPEGGVLVMIRDSYADSEAPFIAEHFSEVHLIDPRYYKIGGAAYAEQVGADAVVVSYGISNLITTTDLIMIGR